MSESLIHEEEEFIDELFSSHCRDTGSSSSAKDAKKRLRALLLSQCTASMFKLVNNGLGVNCSVALAKLLSRSATLSKVNVYGNLIRDAGVLAFLQLVRAATNIVHLELGCNDIGHDGAIALAQELRTNRHLQTLGLGSDTGSSHTNRVSEAAGIAFAEALCVNCALKVLNLNNTGICADGQKVCLEFANMLSKNHTLTTLKLAGNELGTVGGVTIVRSLSENSMVTELDLSYNAMGPQVAMMMSQMLSSGSGLKTLDLGHNPLTTTGIATLSDALLTNDTITSLDLECTGMRDAGATALSAALEQNNSLRMLSIANNGLQTKGGSAVANTLHGNPSLRTLIMHSNAIRDPVAASFGKVLQSNNVLLKLDLHCCKIGDSGAIAMMMALVSNESLRMLNLADNCVTERGGRQLAEVIQENTRLDRLDLSANQLDHATMTKISKTCSRNRELEKAKVPMMLKYEIDMLQDKEERLWSAEVDLETIIKERQDMETLINERTEEIENVKMEYFSKTQQVNKQTENYGNLLREVRERIAAKEAEILDVNKEFSAKIKVADEELKAEASARSALQMQLDVVNGEIDEKSGTSEERLAVMKERIEAIADEKQRLKKESQELAREVSKLQQEEKRQNADKEKHDAAAKDHKGKGAKAKGKKK